MWRASAIFTPIRGIRNTRKIAEKLFFNDPTETICQSPLKLFKKLFWIIVYLSGTVLTALTCYDVYQTYQTYPVTVSNTNCHNDTITLPDATVCLPFFHPEARIEAEITYYGCEDMSCEWYRSTYYTRGLQNFFGNYSSWQAMRQTDNWPFEVLYSAQVYLSHIYKAETSLEYGENSLHFLNADMSINITDENSTDILLAIATVLKPKMMEWNVTLGEFRDSFAEKFREFNPWYVRFISSNFSRDLDNISLDLVFVTQHQVCYIFKLQKVAFTLGSTLQIKIDTQNLLYDNRGRITEPSSEPVTVDFSGNTRAGSILREFDLTYLVGFGSGKGNNGNSYNPNILSKLIVNPSIEYISLPVVKGIPQCSSDTTGDVCQRKCRTETIEKQCNCTAITAPSQLALQTKYCRIGQYENCLAENVTMLSTKNCIDKCLDSCVRWQYDVLKPNTDFIHLNGTDKTYTAVIEIQVSTFNFLIFEESSDWSLAFVIGAVGGASGFWLGLDIITIVYHLLTAPIILLLDRKYPKKTVSNDIQTVSPEVNQVEEEQFFWYFIDAIKIQLKMNTWDIHDAQFIKYLVRKIIWYVLLLIGAVLTTNMFVLILQQYKEGGFQSNVTVNFNKTVALPASALCLPVLPLSEFDWNSSLYQSEYDTYINGLNKDIFLGAKLHQSWPPFLNFMVSYYLEVTFLIVNGKFKGNPNRLDPNDEVLILNLTHDLLTNLSVTNEELQQKFALEFAKLHNITAYCLSSAENKTYSMAPTTTTMEESYSLWLGWTETSVCLHFPLENFEFRSVSDKCSFTMDRINSDESGQYYLAFDSAIMPKFRYETHVLFSQFYRRVIITFGYSVVYQSITDCSMEISSPAVCLTNCQKKFIETMCQNCTQMTTSADLKQCTWDEYQTCLISTLNIWRINCSNECQSAPCTKAMYTMQWVFDKYEYSEYSNISSQELNLQFQDFIYTSMSEQPIWTEEQFIASAGGVLGFWLGLDATFFISIFFLPLLFILEVHLKMKTKNTVNVTQISKRQFSLMKSAARFFLGLRFESVPFVFLIKSLFEQIFWKVVYVAFGILTFSMCNDFYQQYRTSQIMSVSSTIRNRTFTIPSTSICVPWYENNFRRWKKWVGDGYYAQAVYEQDNLYQDFTKLNITRQLIVDSGLTWPTSLLRIVHQYLNLIEGYKAMEQTDLSNMWSAYGNNSLFVTNSKSAVEILADKLELHDISGNELLQKFGQELRRIYLIKLTKYVGNDGTLLANYSLKVNRTTFVSDTKVCFALPSETISFASVYEYVSIEINKSSLPFFESSNQSGCHAQNTYNFENNLNTVDLLGRDTGAVGGNEMLTAYFGQPGSLASIEIGEVVQMLPVVNGEQRCSESVTQIECMKQCRISAIEQHCNCTPSEANQLKEIGEKMRVTCSWTRYKDCMPSFSETKALDCMENCVPSCNQIRYVINDRNVQTDANLPGGHNCMAKTVIGPSSLQYFMFSERLQWTFYSFASGMGGTLSIWLGLDFVWFIEWLLSVGNWLFNTAKKLSKKKKTTGNPLVRRLN